ncbi:PA14 domain-containing protein [Ferruginibacter sp.]|uniref:PA14 domain-containing protein n=1 Tax=Ferruginibacter sp. TaxID=1940288 RepID=UPI0019BE5B16|nr:PA14 domain-containing protein [Ferruginibacter sp.]MBC7629037.1 T9SS type A sorting domain-containing protein [Ferruginibacter sp.]
MQRCLFQLLVFILLSFISAAQVSVLTQHNNTYRTGWSDKETLLNHSNVLPSKFGLAATLAVDNQVYAQPLVAANITIGIFRGNVLFVATVNNTVYAFNADDLSQPAPLWQINLNPSGHRAPDVFDLQDAAYGKPCGGNYRDFSGKMGLVGTPVIDSVSGTLYVVIKTIDANGKFYSYLNALNIYTGLHKAGSPQLISAQVNGSGDGNVNGVIQYDAKYANQRPGLLLYNNIIYLATASHCDWGPYHGWVMGYDAETLQLQYTYNATPNGWAAGIWMAGQGISVGDDGNLYLVTGNGTTGADNTNFTGGRSESLIKLSPQLKMLDWFTPANYDYLDQLDLDYGSDGVLMIPNSSLTISGSKEGISYVVDYNNMGRLTTGNTQVKDTLEFNPGRQGNVHVHGSPVYAKFTTGEFVYAWAETFKIRQFQFNRSTGTFANDFKQGQRNLENGMPGAMLSVSSNLADTSSAIVWGCFPSSGNANNQVRPGTIAAYRANDVSAGELWNSDMDTQNAVGSFAKFAPPTIANGKVFVPAFSNSIKVYGLSCNDKNLSVIYGNGTGLKAEYFTNTTGTDFPATATVTKLDKNINFNWGNDSPAAAVSNDHFKVRWTGTLRPLTTDTYTFYATASDGVRLWINNTEIINQWSDNIIQTHTATVSLQKNTDYDIRLEYYSNINPAFCALQWSAAGICRQIISTSQLFAPAATCIGNGTGLKAEYFSNTAVAADFPAIATLTQTEPAINFNWSGGSPNAIISNNLFKARFTGNIKTTDAGTYTFYVTADDGIRLWVNNQLLVDKWIDQGATEYQATVHLAACTAYPIRIEYYQNQGDAVCKLEWSGPVTDRHVVPSAQLFIPDEVKTSQPFAIYPNPANDLITIATKNNFTQGDLVLIYNMLGQKLSETSSGLAGINKINIAVAKLAAGVYVATIVSNGTRLSVKFIHK